MFADSLYDFKKNFLNEQGSGSIFSDGDPVSPENLDNPFLRHGRGRLKNLRNSKIGF